MKHLSKTLIATVGLLSTLFTAPIASAAGVTLNLPGISIGVHDNHRYTDNRRRYRSQHYRNDQYNDRRHHKNRKYRRHNNHDYDYDRRGYNRYDRSGDNRYDRSYNDHNYYGGSNNYNRPYYRSNRSQVCPDYGYTPHYNRNQNCYRHDGHFHCS